MGDIRHTVRQPYQDLYTDYYADPQNTFLKREISAVQTLDVMTKVIGTRVFDKLLDVGAGDGNVLSQLHARRMAREYYAVEISASGIEAIKARQLPLLSDVQLFDGYTLPYPDKSFDIAIAVHVLEHVEHERWFLREMSRVSRHVYVEVPLEHGFGIHRAIESGKKYGHINFYTRATLRSLLESSGLNVVDCNVVAPSLQYEQHLSGPMKGWIKNSIRRSALTAAPSLAPWFITYNGYALCECSAS
jgi:SAM-dependent methyltransferase